MHARCITVIRSYWDELFLFVKMVKQDFFFLEACDPLRQDNTCVGVNITNDKCRVVLFMIRAFYYFFGFLLIFWTNPYKTIRKTCLGGPGLALGFL